MHIAAVMQGVICLPADTCLPRQGKVHIMHTSELHTLLQLTPEGLASSIMDMGDVLKAESSEKAITLTNTGMLLLHAALALLYIPVCWCACCSGPYSQSIQGFHGSKLAQSIW